MNVAVRLATPAMRSSNKSGRMTFVVLDAA